MIGNRIKYSKWNFDYPEDSPLRREEKEGLVVDAFTEVSGYVSGSSDSFLGFGSGSVSGSTNSRRKYIVEYDLYGYKRYEKIDFNQIDSIIEYAKLVVLDEKIITTK